MTSFLDQMTVIVGHMTYIYGHYSSLRHQIQAEYYASLSAPLCGSLIPSTVEPHDCV